MTAIPPLPGPPPAPGRSLTDAAAARTSVFDSVLSTAKTLQPVSAGPYQLTLTDPEYIDPPDVTPAQYKKAVLTGGTLARRMKGTWNLTDATGAPIAQKRSVVAAVPYLLDGGVVVKNGSDYGIGLQRRLRPGIYTRQKDSGEIESHINVLPGFGLTHRYRLDPATRKLRVVTGTSEASLVSFARALGASDEEMKEVWGPEVWKANAGDNDTTALTKLYERFVPARRRKAEEATGKADPRAILRSVLEEFPLDETVNRSTLGLPFPKLSKDAVLAATKKILQVSRGEVEPDDREHEAYQSYLGAEDLFSERLRVDHGAIRRKLAYKAMKNGNLDHIGSGALTPQLTHVISGSGLATNLEGINPFESLDRAGRITPMGEGGLPDTDAVPSEARSLRPSVVHFQDPFRTVESLRVGVDVNAAMGARKGPDGRLYNLFRDRAGRPQWLSAADLLGRTFAHGHTALTDRYDVVRPDGTPGVDVAAVRNNRDDLVPEESVEYRSERFGRTFSPLAALISFKPGIKPHRISMGSRMLTQALPLLGAEAPYVQSADPEDPKTSLWKTYGTVAGAVRADQPGHVTKVTDDSVSVRQADGSLREYALAVHRPNNRKSGFHQTATVRPGDRIEPGSLIARSNFTDDKGVAAVGLNLRVGYYPYEGLPHEDAVAISAAAAKRLTSDHYYKHGAEFPDGSIAGLRDYLTRFPTRFKPEQLKDVDPKTGVIKVGAKVTKGMPLVVGLRPARADAASRVARRAVKPFADATQVWEHDMDGVVTDVADGPDGPVVIVKAASPAKVGDKISGLVGDKGIISAIIPDDEMPRDSTGKPLEILVNSTGLTSRENPGQAAELALGKIADRLGKRFVVDDDEDPNRDIRAWASAKLKEHGLSLAEPITLPKYGNAVVPKVAVGSRYFLKLHHLSEGKMGARGGGAYSADEAPARGGPGGCFAADTALRLADGTNEAIRTIGRGRSLAMTGGPVEVTDTLRRAGADGPLVKVRMSDGAAVVCTADHEWYVAAGGSVRADALAAGTRLEELA